MSNRICINSRVCTSIVLSVITASAACAAAQSASQFNTEESPRLAGEVSDTELVTLPHSHLALSADVMTTARPLSPSALLKHLQLVLLPSVTRQKAAEALIAAQHDPTATRYRKFVTPTEYGEAFGVVEEDVETASAWLRRSGLEINSVSAGRTLIDFSGSVSAVEAAFHTKEVYVTTSEGIRLANTSDIQVPKAFSGVIDGVVGLTTNRPTPMKTPTVKAKWDAGARAFRPTDSRNADSSAIANPDALSLNNGFIRGLVPGDMRTIYGVNPLIKEGFTGKGITIAVVEDGAMVPADWTNFVQYFGLAKFGGTFKQIAPPPSSGRNNCYLPTATSTTESEETVLDAEYATGLAPSANIVVAVCSDFRPSGSYASDNEFGGVFIAATNLINAKSGRPNIISVSYGLGEKQTRSSSKTAIDALWKQADAEGISVFVSSGDSGSNPSFNGHIIEGFTTTVDANSLATSPNVTAVGGSDFSDLYEKQTGYFRSANNVAGGTAISYVPEIPWNESCANPIPMAAAGYRTPLAACKAQMLFDPRGLLVTSEAGSGGPSSVDPKPQWQSIVYGATNDKMRDVPDVSLFAGSYGYSTFAVICTALSPCSDAGYLYGFALTGGTSLSAPMFAGIQALIDQSLAATDGNPDVGNAAPTLYRLAALQLGSPATPNKAGLQSCNATLGKDVADSCAFHNIQRGSIVTNCAETAGVDNRDFIVTLGCAIYGRGDVGLFQIGLTTTETESSGSSLTFTNANAAYYAKPGWSFASGLGSVNAFKLDLAWLLYAGQ